MAFGWFWGRFTLGLKKCAILVSNVNKWGAYTCVGTGSIWETSFSQFCCKPTTVIKMSFFFKALRSIDNSACKLVLVKHFAREVKFYL